MMLSTSLLLEDDGTAEVAMPDGSELKCRHCAMDVHGSVAGLLAEMRSRRKSEQLPWESKEARDAAADVVREMSGLTARARSVLVRHIGRTPYIDCSIQKVGIRFARNAAAPDFAYHRVARTILARSHDLGDLRAEAARFAGGQATGAEPVPYASRELRDKQAECIKKEKDLPEDERARLLAHVARTPYLQTA